MSRSGSWFSIVAVIALVAPCARADDGGVLDSGLADAIAPPDAANLGSNGAYCTAPGDCASGFCVDDVCCDSACTGQCEACDNYDGTYGQCAPVLGAPHASKPACPAGTASNPCAGASCDGITTATCAGFAGSDVPCGAAACANGVESFTGACDGAGACDPRPSVPCGPFACGAESCKTSCASATDCASGATCLSGQCVAGSTCDGAHTVTGPSGVKTDCSPYVCQPNGTCLAACTTDRDCISASVCSAEDRCISALSNAPVATAPGGSSGGCANAPSPRGGGAGALVAIGVAVAAAGVRRRRRPLG